MDAGRVRTVLGCGNPKTKLWHAYRVLKIPLAFAVGEPATYVQAPKAKGRRSRASFGFPTPRSRVFRAVCGGAPQTFSLDLAKELGSDCISRATEFPDEPAVPTINIARSFHV